jgi:hypothetical protein
MRKSIFCEFGHECGVFTLITGIAFAGGTNAMMKMNKISTGYCMIGQFVKGHNPGVKIR